MRLVVCEQGTAEWRQARAGVPTASRFEEITTPKTLQPSKSSTGYIYELLAEWRLGRPLDDGAGSIWTDRGTALEDEARSDYAWDNDVKVERVGFALSDCGRYGCSPDGLVGSDGGLEIKCPGAGVHARALDDPDWFRLEHRMQVQGGLLVTGRKWWDLVSHCPDFPAVRLRIEPEAEVQEALRECLAHFCARLELARERWVARGLVPLAAPVRLPREPVAWDIRTGAL